jgi:ribosomal protein S27E
MPHPPSDDEPSDLRQELVATNVPGELRQALDAANVRKASGHDFVLKCDKCGERMAVQVHDRQSALAVECSKCGAVANAAIHWALGRSDPISIFDATRGA